MNSCGKAARDGEQDGAQPLGRNDRVSLYPLDPEVALGALLATPLLARGQAGPACDYGDDG